MPKIIVCKNMQDYRVVDIQSQASIGRDQSNEIVLDSRGVSRKHALILKQTEDRYHLIDQGSKNGVWIGNEISREFELSHGLTFRIADHLLTFVDDDPLWQEPAVCFDENRSETEFKTDGNETMLMVDFQLAKGEIPSDESSLSIINSGFSELLSKAPSLLNINDAEELLLCLLELVVSLSDAAAGFIALQEESGELMYKATVNFSPKTDNSRVAHNVISLLCDRNIESSGVETSGDHFGENSYHNYFCLPLRYNGQTLGCCYLLRKKGFFFRKTQMNFVRTALLVGCERYGHLRYPHFGKNEDLDRPQKSITARDVIARSRSMVRLFSDVQTMSTINVPLLVLGEPGTGKELVASALHKASGRKGQYVTLNCSAIPEGIFESELFGSVKGAYHDAVDRKGKIELANKGTLFLDEIGDMTLSLQPKLLRFLENQELTRLGDTRLQKLDVRIVAATNQDLKAMIDQRTFRADLYQRLSCFSLEIPPLRERIDDIEPLSSFFLDKFAEEYGLPLARITTKAMDILKRYSWPGNVRELRNTILRLTVFAKGEAVGPEELHSLLDNDEQVAEQKVSSFLSLDALEKEHLQAALRYTNWNISDASKMLGIARSTFYKKARKYDIGLEQS